MECLIRKSLCIISRRSLCIDDNDVNLSASGLVRFLWPENAKKNGILRTYNNNNNKNDDDDDDGNNNIREF